MFQRRQIIQGGLWIFNCRYNLSKEWIWEVDFYFFTLLLQFRQSRMSSRHSHEWLSHVWTIHYVTRRKIWGEQTVWAGIWLRFGKMFVYGNGKSVFWQIYSSFLRLKLQPACKHLWCTTGEESGGCKTQYMLWADGTSCGPRK